MLRRSAMVRSRRLLRASTCAGSIAVANSGAFVTAAEKHLLAPSRRARQLCSLYESEYRVGGIALAQTYEFAADNESAGTRIAFQRGHRLRIPPQLGGAVEPAGGEAEPLLQIERSLHADTLGRVDSCAIRIDPFARLPHSRRREPKSAAIRSVAKSSHGPSCCAMRRRNVGTETPAEHKPLRRRGRRRGAGGGRLQSPGASADIGGGRLAVDEPLANRVRSGRKQP